MEEGLYTVNVAHNNCPVTTLPKEVIFKPGLPKPTLYAYGPDYWFFVCDNRHAKIYRWYCNGSLVAENDKSQFYAGINLGEYYVEVNDGRECFVPSDKVVIPLDQTGMVQTEAEHDFYLYPNPTNGNIQIFYSSPFSGRIVIRIYNVEGEVAKELEIHKEQYYYTEQMELSGFRPGMYIMELYSDQVIRRTRFLVF
jgi:hypothetical protein